MIPDFVPTKSMLAKKYPYSPRLNTLTAEELIIKMLKAKVAEAAKEEKSA